MQRAAERAARHSAQRLGRRSSSIVGPLLLLGLGTVLLLAQFGRLSLAYSLEWFGHGWPVVLIAAGVVLLLEWALDRRAPHAAGPRMLGGGTVLLLVLLALVGVTARMAHGPLAKLGYPWSTSDLDAALGERHDEDNELSAALAPGGALLIDDANGAVTVTGDSPDDAVHVTVHEQTRSWRPAEARHRAELLRPSFSTAGRDLTLRVAAVEGGSADLTVQVPHATALTIAAGRGDIDVSNLLGALTISADHGDIDLDTIGGPVTLHVNDDDASLNLRKLGGSLTIEGHSGDIDGGDIDGDVVLHGDFFGETDLERLHGALSFETSRTTFHAARVEGEFNVGRDSLEVSDILGPVSLKTSDKNVTLDRVAGPVEITDSNGEVTVTHAPPMAQVRIATSHGSVDLALPGDAAFTVTAQTQNGHIENDFVLSPQPVGDGGHQVAGRVGSGGPSVSITTSDGDITLRKSSITPLPPATPAPPSPPTPATPATPKAPRPPALPHPAHPPASVTF